jgi:PAS domain S-box-containing protein
MVPDTGRRLSRRALLFTGATIVGITAARLMAGAAGASWTAPVIIALGLAGVLSVVAALRAVARDEAASRALLDRLRASEQQAAGITSLAIDSIITIDEQQRIVVFNQGAETTFGWKAAEVMGRPLSILLPERVHAAHARHVQNFGAGKEVARRMGQRQTIVGLRRDGTEFPAEASISRLDLPGRRLFTVVLRDITERQRQLQDERFLATAGATLGASLDYESTLVSAVHLPVPYLADCCVLDLVNEDQTTRRIASVHDDPDRTRVLRSLEHRQAAPGNWPLPVERVLATGEVETIEAGQDGTAGAVHEDRPDLVAGLGVTSITSLPLTAGGRLTGVLSLIQTDRQRQADPDRVRVAESVGKLIALAIENARLYQTAQRATTARDEILGAVSHDLRNPLAAISLCAHALKEGTTENRGEIVDAIVESAGMMNRMIQDLLDVATIDSGHLRLDPSEQQLDELLERVLDMTHGAAREREVLLKEALPSSLPPVMVDSTRFVQVLANLVGNAVKFTEPGGSVTITAQPAVDEVVIAVRDTGIGIPPSHLPHIFDRHWHAHRSTGHRTRTRHRAWHRRSARWPDLGRQYRRTRKHVFVHRAHCAGVYGGSIPRAAIAHDLKRSRLPRPRLRRNRVDAQGKLIRAAGFQFPGPGGHRAHPLRL